jgi:aspartyl-tRNA(Asn)/glutamyl-tRNA(Gln) amidotransferase subunit C
MRLTTDQVKKVAKLANLSISEKDEEKFSDQLTAILDYIEELNTVNTEGIKPLFNINEATNVLRDDKDLGNGLSQEDALSNAPQKKDGFFVTKGVFSGE